VCYFHENFIIFFKVKINYLFTERGGKSLLMCSYKTGEEGDDNIKMIRMQVNCNWKVIETVLEHVQ